MVVVCIIFIIIVFKNGTMHKLRGAVAPPPPNFLKILNSKYIFKILENKPKINYICPPRLRILVPSLIVFAPTKYKTVFEHKGYHPWAIDTKHTKLESNQGQWQKGGATLVRGRHTKDERTRINKGEKKNK